MGVTVIVIVLVTAGCAGLPGGDRGGDGTLPSGRGRRRNDHGDRRRRHRFVRLPGEVDRLYQHGVC